MEANKIKMNMDGTIRAKVLQYKSDGNTLTDKWETLAKYAEGVYYTTDDDGYGNTIHGIVFEAKGVYWWSRQALRPEELNADNIYCQKVMEKRRNFEHNIMAQAEAGQYINNLQIEVMRRLGHEVAALQAAHDEYIRQREERDRLQAEEAERRERERREAEERRKAEVLADGKEKLLKHESITVEQIELIAEAVGYKTHIRTIGFMREKVTEVVMLDNDRVQVFGYKLTSRNIDGTAKVMHELCDRLKAQAEEEAKQAAQATEMPRISTETAETVNVSAEGENAENEPQKHISEVLKEAERNYQCVKSETLRTVREADGKWHTYFMDEEIGIDLAYDQINHIPAARAAQAAEEVAEIRRYMNRLNGNHIADADYYLAEMREGIKQAEAARRKKNADTEGENKAERAKYRVSRFGGYKIIVGDREQGKVMAVLMAVNGHNVIEINDESAHIATMGEKPLQMDKPITQLSDAEVLGLIYGYIEPPQSPETPQTVECTAEHCKLAQTA